MRFKLRVRKFMVLAISASIVFCYIPIKTYAWEKPCNRVDAALGYTFINSVLTIEKPYTVVDAKALGTDTVTCLEVKGEAVGSVIKGIKVKGKTIISDKGAKLPALRKVREIGKDPITFEKCILQEVETALPDLELNLTEGSVKKVIAKEPLILNATGEVITVVAQETVSINQASPITLVSSRYATVCMPTTAEIGSMPTITVIPDKGYSIQAVKQNGTKLQAYEDGKTYPLNPVDGNTEIVVQIKREHIVPITHIRVVGRITLNDEPLSGVTVKVWQMGATPPRYTTMSNENGYYEFVNIPVGHGLIYASYRDEAGVIYFTQMESNFARDTDCDMSFYSATSTTQLEEDKDR